MMKEQDTPPSLLFDLRPSQQKVDSLLAIKLVADELTETRYKASQCRTDSREEVLNEPPRFRFVYEYHAAIYDLKKKEMHEGQWSDLHFWIAQDKGVAKPDDSMKNIQRYVSCDVFSLRAAQWVRIAVVNTLHGFKLQDLVALENLGYVIMSPEYEWLVNDPSQIDGVGKIPSKIS